MRRVSFLLSALCVLACSTGKVLAEDHSVIIVSQGDKTVYDTDPATGKVINKIQLEGTPTEAVYSWDERWLFVAVPEQGYISVINARTFKESSRFTRPEFKRAAGATGLSDVLVTTPDFKKLYVSVPGGVECFDQKLLVYSPEYAQAGTKIAITGTDGQRMLVQGPTQKLYHALGKANQVAVIDTNTDKLLKMVPVKGGPTDVAFMIGGEAWVTSADGTVSVIDTNKDEVVKTIATSGKGPARIITAPDVRYIATSHNDSGDVTILQPITKEVVGTVKVDMKGPLSVRFTPPNAKGAKAWSYPPTNQIYVFGDSGMVTVDLDKMSAGAPVMVGTNDSANLIHYTYAESFMPPREGTSTRIVETDLYTLFDNAMFVYDLSPIHEHRTDMAAVIVGEGVAKIGCWEEPACTETKSKMGITAGINAQGGTPYSYTESRVGGFTGVPRGTLHEEEGVTPMPREMIIFMPKNNYYRQKNPKKVSALASMPNSKLITDNTRIWLYDVVLVPGQPVTFPANTDYAFVYIAGGLLRETHNGVPSIEHRLFKDWELDSTEKTVEALSNRIHLTVMEFK